MKIYLGNRVITTNDASQVTLAVSAGGPGTLEERSADGTLQREFVYGHDFLEPIVMVDHTSAGALPAGQSEPLYYLQGGLCGPKSGRSEACSGCRHGRSPARREQLR